MHFLRLAFFLPLLANAITLPDDAQEGFAIHLQDDDGNDLYIHESEFEKYNVTMIDASSSNDTTFGPPPSATSLERRGLPSGDSITCEWSKPVPIGDLHNGMIDFADYLGCGRTAWTSQYAEYKYVAYVYWSGSTVFYTCNYSNSQRLYSGPALVDYTEQVFEYCKQGSVAAWYYDNYRKVSWGFTTRNYGYCGPAQ